MSDNDEMQALFEAFVAGFMRPLLTGEPVQLTRPLGTGLLDHFAVASCADSAADAAVFEALYELAEAHAPVRALAYPERRTRAFHMAVHDALTLTDPLLDRTLSRRAVPEMRDFVFGLLDAAGAARTRGEVLARHVVLDRALGLSRRDVVVKNWAYTYRFFGRPVPANVVMLPRLRRVRQTAVDQTALALLGGPSEATVGVLDALLARSALTRLLRFEQTAQPLLDVATLAALEDPPVRQGAIFRLSQRETSGVLARIGAELLRLWSEQRPPRLVAIAARFGLELVMQLQLAEDAPSAPADGDHKLESALMIALPFVATGSALWPALAPSDDAEARRRAADWASGVEGLPHDTARQLLAIASKEATPRSAPEVA